MVSMECALSHTRKPGLQTVGRARAGSHDLFDPRADAISCNRIDCKLRRILFSYGYSSGSQQLRCLKLSCENPFESIDASQVLDSEGIHRQKPMPSMRVGNVVQ